MLSAMPAVKFLAWIMNEDIAETFYPRYMDEWAQSRWVSKRSYNTQTQKMVRWYNIDGRYVKCGTKSLPHPNDVSWCEYEEAEVVTPYAFSLETTFQKNGNAQKSLYLLCPKNATTDPLAQLKIALLRQLMDGKFSVSGVLASDSARTLRYVFNSFEGTLIAFENGKERFQKHIDHLTPLDCLRLEDLSRRAL